MKVVMEMLGREADGTEDLERLLADPSPIAARERLDDLVHACRSRRVEGGDAIGHGRQRGVIGTGSRQEVAHGLEAADRPTELLASACVPHREIQGALGGSDDLQGNRDPAQKLTSTPRRGPLGLGFESNRLDATVVECDLVKRLTSRDANGFEAGVLQREEPRADARSVDDHAVEGRSPDEYPDASPMPGVSMERHRSRIGLDIGSPCSGDVRSRHEEAQGGRTAKLSPLGAEYGQNAEPRLEIIEVFQQIPPTEGRERRDAPVQRDCVARTLDEGFIQRARQDGSSNNCLAIVSSCICSEPPYTLTIRENRYS